ncbi:MAG: nicotinate phosphoribosyltransferase [Nocardioidaceae bacterium]
MTSTALLTDHYELTMLQAALRSGAAQRRSVFEVFARRLPAGRRYGVVAGTGRVLDALADFCFDAPTLDFLHAQRVVDDTTLEWLASYRFRGDIWGYPEGETYFPGSPLVVVEASFAEAVVLETMVLSIMNHDCAVAAAASRMIGVADGRPCIEMGARRTHEEAAIAAARAAYLVGFSATSSLEAGRRYGIPTSGTSAHSFTLLHDTERAAFTAQVESLGAGTTLLVDTYDIAEAVRMAVDIAGPELGAVRIDSGDLPLLAREVRSQLDALGARETRVIVTSDLDEYAIAALAAAPVDGYGVGTALVIGSGFPTCGFVYKLVARGASSPGSPLVPVAKRSTEKLSIGGRKWALRRRSATGTAQAEVLGISHRPRDDGDDRALLVPLVREGERVHDEPLDAMQDRHDQSVAELPLAARQLSRGEPAIPTVYEEAAL